MGFSKHPPGARLGRLATALGEHAAEVSLDEFASEFDTGEVVLPYTTCLLGFSARRRGWLVHGFKGGPGYARQRLDALTAFLERHVRAAMSVRHFWFFFHHWDGWREGTTYSAAYRRVPAPPSLRDTFDWPLGPGEIPILSPRRDWVACFGAHRGDPSAVLLPEPHFLTRFYHRPLFWRLRVERRPWRLKRPRAVFAGGDHGFPEGAERPRRMLARVAEADQLPVDVHLGAGVSRRAQIAYKYLLDVDGWVRTADAWAWKLASGSVVLARASHWESLFTQLFQPWEHYVPVAGHYSDLAERVEDCRRRDAECRLIARRAGARVKEVYDPRWVGRSLARTLDAQLTDG